jgi:hypothetical protein
MPYLLGTPVSFANILAVVQPRKDLLNDLLLLTSLLLLQTLSTHAGLLLLVLQSLLGELNVLEAQFLANDVQISRGVDITFDVDNLSIVEAADDLEDGVDGTNVGKEGIAKTGTGRRTASQTSNIVDGQVCGDDRLGLVLLHQPVEALVWDDDTRLLRFDGGIGKVLDAVST